MKLLTFILNHWIKPMVDFETLLTPISHDIYNMAGRGSLRRHYIRVFGLRVISWVK